MGDAENRTKLEEEIIEPNTTGVDEDSEETIVANETNAAFTEESSSLQGKKKGTFRKANSHIPSVLN